MVGILESFDTMNVSPSSPDPAVSARPTVNHERFSDMDTRSVKFKLDDGTMYNVLRHFFEQSASFVEEYLSAGDVDVVELKGVSRADFDRFLSYMFPSSLGKCDITTSEEWLSILRLADKWRFTDLRAHALGMLKSTASPIDRILIAREFDVPDWLLPAFIDICMAPDPPSEAEAEQLGLSALVKIGRVREQYVRIGGGLHPEHDLVIIRQTVIDEGLVSKPIKPKKDPRQQPLRSAMKAPGRRLGGLGSIGGGTQLPYEDSSVSSTESSSDESEQDFRPRWGNGTKASLDGLGSVKVSKAMRDDDDMLPPIPFAPLSESVQALAASRWTHRPGPKEGGYYEIIHESTC
ncbi:uncharacterized protein SCHCODRAFT_02630666 [Schizophyllum commune H4-8]|uniref:Expressed protein n=1 Tax=Schizophyllum commune (strain H4-8 / FGSC 9210) TaxID=578458 RepID=D8QAF0_SCHCM|nr:uncharacterized protein SCHCODRAFT_02630666 [Schizophyllum commune H4-8]KAI5890027.1 hypothetical protein SCHCODRAFT_02630666 [Schizophyllum commune H4-8]